MIDLLHKVLSAHGGIERWNAFESVQATIVTGGQLFEMKGMPQESTPRRMSAATKREWSSVTPFGAPDQRTDFSSSRVAIEKADGTLVKERFHPAQHAEGKTIDAPWDALDRAYFNGYALWTYLTTPFHFALPGFAVQEITPWSEGQESWRGLRVTYPAEIATHSRTQEFYFGPEFILRRHDYNVDAAGGFAAAHYVYDTVTVQGITLPTKRRAFMRDKAGMPIHHRLMVSIDISEIGFS